MMFRFAALVFAAAVSTYGVLTANSASSAPKQKEFVIHNDDGYGTTDCLVKSAACGQIVADAWCEAKGFRKSVSFRPIEPGEITASTGRGGTTEAFMITCAD